MIKVGDKAPDFELEDQSGEKIKLSDLKGKKVLISFHPLAWTSVCIDQMRQLDSHFSQIENKGVDLVLGISVDPQPTKSVWAKSMALKKIKILADFEPKGKMAKDYGLYNDSLGASERANVLVNEDGKVSWVKKYEISHLPNIEEVIENLD
ncbi:MAG TPA: redoxin domain-containing protein [Candidatus Eisenbacteria bacterium]|nr:redoxin domain-containing protein [Candidatus Eisenbacteria bacterium]